MSEYLWLIIAYPQQFGGRETWKCGITHEFQKTSGAHSLSYPTALRLTTLISPDDGWP